MRAHSKLINTRFTNSKSKELLHKFQLKSAQFGFTLIELVVVMVLLGVMAVGISGFMGVSTQIYVNVSDRDELMSTARFVVERINREVRQAVPNSIRIATSGDGDVQCLEFMSIAASSVYVELPIAPESDDTSNDSWLIPFLDSNGNTYVCRRCSDVWGLVYPLNTNELYKNSYGDTGKIFEVSRVDLATGSSQSQIFWQQSNVLFDEASPTERLYIVEEQISYCLIDQQIRRYANNVSSNIGDATQLTPPNNGVLMAEFLAELADSGDVFNYTPSTLQRNAIVQVNLHFHRHDENIVFNNEVHIQNVP